MDRFFFFCLDGGDEKNLLKIEDLLVLVCDVGVLNCLNMIARIIAMWMDIKFYVRISKER